MRSTDFSVGVGIALHQDAFGVYVNQVCNNRAYANAGSPGMRNVVDAIKLEGNMI